MSLNPLVSVVINNFNYERFIGAAIESALSQTYENFEVIVVDDGSTDRSRDAVARYGDRVRLIAKSNGGQASAFNAGFTASRGEWVCFLDSDDTWTANKLSCVVEAVRARPSAVLVYHPVLPVDRLGNVVGKPWPSCDLQGKLGARVLRSGGWWPYPPTSALAFRRDYLSLILPIPEDEFRICADAYLADAAPVLGDIYGMPEALACYRLHGENNWSNSLHAGGSAESLQIQLRRYELRVKGLNDTLARLGVPGRAKLEDHWAYQRIRYSLGENTSLFSLVRLAIRPSSEPRMITRLAALTRMLLFTRKQFAKASN